jgi:hypothetical protein
MRKDNVLNVMEQTDRKRAHFLDAWKRGVAYLGPELFGPGTLAAAKDKNDLQPLPQEIEAVFARESGGVEQFIAAMVSFYDPVWGEELVDRIDCIKSLCGLTYNLDHECTQIICELLLNYEGW